VEFEHELAPAAHRVGLCDDEILPSADGAPFFQEDEPSGMGGGLNLRGGGLASSACGGEVGDFVFHERAD